MASPLPTAKEVAKMDLVNLLDCAERMGIEGYEDFQTDEEYREAIFQHLRSVAQATASPTLSSGLGAGLPSPGDVMRMDLMQLHGWAKMLGVKDFDDFETAEEFRDAIFLELKKQSNPEVQERTKPTPFAATANIFKDFVKKQQRVASLIAKTKQLVDRADLGPWQEKLNLPRLSNWMTDKDFNRASDSIMKGKPVLLVAGSTSSGKSTLLNALLGTSILPTSYNAATSVLCEISCSEDGSKYALLHMEGRKKKEPKRLDLTTANGQEKFKKYVSPSRDHQTSKTKGKRCSKAEIFWPLDFLKDITLLDSPGVTEEEGEDAAARQIVDQCQNDIACGFIYVLNGTIAAEEGAQVGGLLKAIIKGNKQLPPPDAAIFVINKWDILCQQQDSAQQENFLNLMRREIASRWPGFKERQLITMNARLAARMREMGETTDDLQKLCDAITRVLPIGMDYMVVRALNPVHSLTSTIEHQLQEALYGLKLPPEERMKKWREDWEKFDSFRRSNESGRIFILRNRISKKINELVKNLAVYLKSDEAKKVALKWKREDLGDDEQKLFDEKQAQDLVQERFTKAITQSKQFLDFTRWASGKVMEDVQSVVKDLKVLEVEVSNVSPAGDPGDLLRKFGQEIGQYGGMQKVAAAALTVAMVLVAPVVLALGTLQITLMPLYKLADFISSMGEKRFRKALEKGYNDTVEKSCENNCKVLSATVNEILQTAVEPVKVAFKTIPARIEDLKQRLESRANHEAADIPMFEKALAEVSQMNGCLAKFELEMNIHEFRDHDIDWPEPRTPQSIGSYGSVFEVSLPGKKKAVLKLLQEPITEKNAGDRFKKLLIFRKFLNPKNVISFRGSVVVSHSPLLLGFLFEDYGRLALADLIFGMDWVLPSTGGGFIEANHITMQILDGLDFLHGNAIVHGHLSPDTILLTRMTGGRVKLSEPSTSQPVVHKMTDLTPYLAPEVLSKQMIRQSSDIYSVGVILWEMLTGKRAYIQADLDAMDISEFVRQVTNGELHPGMVLSAEDETDAPQGPVAASWHALAHKCWSTIERERPCLGEVKQALKAMEEQPRRRFQTNEDVDERKKKPTTIPWRHTVTGQPSKTETPAERFRLYSEQIESTEVETALIGIDEHLQLGKESRSDAAEMDSVDVIKRLHEQVSADKVMNSDLKSQLDEQELVITHLQKQLEHAKRDLATTKLTNEEKLKKCEVDRGIVHILEESLDVSDMGIGFGKLGEVRVALWKGSSVAVKILNVGDLTDQNRRICAEELAVASHIHHPNIASIFGVVMSDGLPTHIVMELFEGSISDLITGARLSGPYLTLREQVDLAADIVCGLTHLHNLKPKAVVHGDLRPTNVLITATMVAKVSGVGTWRVLGSSLPPGPYTFSYLPPERLPSQSSVVPRTTVGADLYGLGVTLLEIFSGQPASRREREIQLLEVSVDNLRQLCVFLTEENPQSRMSLRDSKAVLEHVRDEPNYQQCPSKRLVKGKSHGSSFITLVDSPW